MPKTRESTARLEVRRHHTTATQTVTANVNGQNVPAPNHHCVNGEKANAAETASAAIGLRHSVTSRACPATPSATNGSHQRSANALSSGRKKKPQLCGRSRLDHSR